MQAVILASGLNTRVKHVFPDLPKVMFPVAGKPFLHWYLDTIFDQGITEAVVVVFYKKEIIEHFIAEYIKQTGRKISTYTRKEAHGPVGALCELSPKLHNHFALLYGDILYKSPFDIAFSKLNNSEFTGLTFITQDPLGMFADMEIEIDENKGTVSTFNPHAYKHGQGWFDVGQVYVRDSILPTLASCDPSEEHVNVNTWRELIENHTLAYQKVGAVLDVGTESSYKKTCELVSKNGTSVL